MVLYPPYRSFFCFLTISSKDDIYFSVDSVEERPERDKGASEGRGAGVATCVCDCRLLPELEFGLFLLGGAVVPTRKTLAKKRVLKIFF